MLLAPPPPTTCRINYQRLSAHARAMDAETLIRTLRAYDASVDATAVRTAFDASQPGHSSSASSSLRDWVARHVGPDTLLSVDELNQ